MSVSQTTNLLDRALALHRRGAILEASSLYADVLRIDPANADALYYLSLISCHGGRFAEGAELARKSLANDGQHARAHVLLGRALAKLGQGEEALVSFERAIEIAPSLAEAHSHRADVLSELGRHREAINSYDRALALAPDVAADWFNRGAALSATGQHEAAILSFDRAIADRRYSAQAHLHRAKALAQLRRFDEALQAADAALAFEPGLAEAWLGRGNVLTKIKRLDDALSAYNRALELKPDLAEAWLGRGNAFAKMRQTNDALSAYGQALALKPDLAEAWLGRGNSCNALKQYDDAAAAYDRALSLRLDLAEGWLGRGNVFAGFGQYDKALLAYDEASRLAPDLAEAWFSRGAMLEQCRRYNEAFAAYDRAVNLDPNLDYALGGRLNAKLHLCDWTNLQAETAQILSGVRQHKPVSNPFWLLPISISSADQLECAQRYIQDQPSYPPVWRGNIYSHDRIRIAYLSADFREHAVAYLAAGLFEHHDKSRFETTAISFGPNDNSPMRARLERTFEHFVDVSQQKAAAVADLMRRLEIDIAVDLMGLTGNRESISVLAWRPAPVQVTYLGYAGTTGAGYVDYVLADSIVIAQDQCQYYSEEVVWLPDSFMINDDRRHISGRTPTREECGLPERAFVFCCFNNSFKIGPETFQSWMRLLNTIDDSVLWLSDIFPTAKANLRREAQRCGVAPERLIFAPKMPNLADHLARHRQADLFLDTWPYNAHTTASDALWAGVPVVTCMRETFASRVASSLLKAVRLPELIAVSPDQYEALAARIAQDRPYLESLRARLARNRNTSPLFDTKRTTRQIEAAYTMMWERYQSGKAAKRQSNRPQPMRIETDRH